MVKNYFLFYIFWSIVTSNIFSQNYLTENFNSSTFPPTGWNIKNISGNESWIYDEKNKAAFADANTITAQNTWLITPELTITTNAILHFKAKADELVPPDYLFVKISTSGKNVNNFTDDVKAIRIGLNVSKEYNSYKVDLKKYVGKKIHIAFQHKTEFAYMSSYGENYYGAGGFYIDDVVVTSNDFKKQADIIELIAPYNGNIMGEKKVIVAVKNTGDIALRHNEVFINYTFNNKTITEPLEKDLAIDEIVIHEFSTPINIENKNTDIKVFTTINKDLKTANNQNYSLSFHDNISLSENFSGTKFLPNGWSYHYISGPYADRLRRKENTVFIKSTSTTSGDDMLITPKVKIKENTILKFNMNAPDYLDFYANNLSFIKKDELIIKVSETGNNINDFKKIVKSIDLKKHYKKGVYDDISFKDFTIDLSEYTGKDIHIAFDYINNEGLGIGINKVEIGSKISLGTDKVLTPNSLVTVYPNPTTDIIKVSNATNIFATLYSSNGTFIVKKKLSSLNNTINVDHLSSGIYILILQKGLKTITKEKIIKL